MLIKLALKNIKIHFKDYEAYSLTLTFVISIFYIFNSIYGQQKLLEITSTVIVAMLLIGHILSYLSIYITVILGFLVYYSNMLCIRKRKKEIGIYLVLGMNKNRIFIIFTVETFVITFVSLLIGIVSGIFLSQFMSLLTIKLLKTTMSKFVFLFSINATLKCLFFTAIIFFDICLYDSFTILKPKLIDILYYKSVPEYNKILKIKTAICIFLLSIMFIIASYTMIKYIDNPNILAVLANLFNSLGTILFFFSSSSILLKLISASKKIYYKNLNIFTIKQITTKIYSNYVFISIIFIILFLTIGTFTYIYTLKSILSNNNYKIEMIANDSNVIQHISNLEYDFVFKSNKQISPTAVFNLSDVDLRAIIHFIYIYLTFLFIMTCSTIFSLQQITISYENKKNYELLLKLGADSTMLNHSLFIQIAFYFLTPIILACIYSIVDLTISTKLTNHYNIILDKPNLAVTAALFLYCIHFTLTYIESKRITHLSRQYSLYYKSFFERRPSI